MSILFSAYGQADFFGKLIMLALVVMSAFSWCLLSYKIWIMRRVQRATQDFTRSCLENKERLFQLEIDALPKLPIAHLPHPCAAIFLSLKTKTMELLNKNRYFTQAPTAFLCLADLEILEKHVLTTISFQTKQLEKNLYLLSTTVTLAPFMGLLGTVWGILVAFGEMREGATRSNAMVLGGLSTALVTTVMGLLIAIPALVSHNYLRAHLRRLSSDMEDFFYALLSETELQYRKVE
jgi:biopolymer transport protein TolQ